MADRPTNPDDRPRGGRPTKLTDEIALAIAQAILDGSYRYAAAKAYGVSKRTMVRWMQNGRKFPEGAYGLFRRLVVESEAEWERQAVRAVNRAGKEDDPKFLCWLLERKFPQRWGQYRGELGQLKRRIRELERLIGATTPGETDGPA